MVFCFKNCSGDRENLKAENLRSQRYFVSYPGGEPSKLSRNKVEIN